MLKSLRKKAEQTVFLEKMALDLGKKGERGVLGREKQRKRIRHEEKVSIIGL